MMNLNPVHTASLATAPQPGAGITVQLDGHPREVAAGLTLAALVEQLGHAPDAVSSAVNGDFVARGQRLARVLAEGDAVLLFQPIVGG